MELDPHTLQQILERIQNQMRCPQCGKKVPANFESVRVVADSNMLLQLKCQDCNAHIVLQASLQGIDSITAPPYEQNHLANASSGMQMKGTDLHGLRKTIAGANGSFEQLFKDEPKETQSEAS